MVEEHDFTRAEFDWIALDREDYVGLVSSAGAGPVPQASLDDAANLQELYEELLELPVLGEAVRQPGSEHNIDDWLQLARRGIYGFDWCRESGSYRLIAAPSCAVKAEVLLAPKHLRLAGKVVLDITFSSAPDFGADVTIGSPRLTLSVRRR